MNRLDEAKGLIREYLEVIRDEHHKIKDGVFEITQQFDCWEDDPKPCFYVNHPGYVNEFESEGFDTYEEALSWLCQKLREMIPETRKMIADSQED